MGLRPRNVKVDRLANVTIAGRKAQTPAGRPHYQLGLLRHAGTTGVP
jgi:hypothetical protein